MTEITLDRLTGDARLAAIGRKVLSGIRISPEEGLYLFTDAPLGILGALANHVRERFNGNLTYYIRNYHIEPTNICIHKCRFCSYSARQTGNPWEFSIEQMVDKVRNLDTNIRELHIVGGVHPERGIDHYGDLIRNVKSVRPDLHIKAFTAIELDFMIHKNGFSIDEGLRYLKECGLDSIPGGGAEIFDERLRQQICHDKTSSEDWLAIHEAAHRIGIPSNATILYGHIERYGHRIDHMNRLRELQDHTKGFNAFIPLKFKKENNELSGLEETCITEDMRNYAVSRIFLDNFPHIKSYWPMIGRQAAMLSLSFGVDDLDGTINDSTQIYSRAGAEDQNPSLTAAEMRQLILSAGRIPVERDALYAPVK